MSAQDSCFNVFAKFCAPFFCLYALFAIPLRAADEPKPNQCGLCYATSTEGEPLVIALESTEVVLDVKPGFMESEVTQTFTNRTSAALEATYLYPLPHGATLTDFELRFKDHVVHSSVHEKQAANAIYETAKAEGKKTALLTQHDSNLFSTAVANFLPGETVHVVLRFILPIPLTSGAVDIRFPMVTGDKYFPSDSILSLPASTTENPSRVTGPSIAENHFYAFDILVSGIPIQSIQSESHRIKVQNLDGEHARVSLDQELTIPDRDFLLRIETRDTQQLTSTVVNQHTDTGDYGLLTVFPPLTQTNAAKTERPRDVLFLVDHSGSMGGPRMASARLGLKHCLPMLKPSDRFQIVIFDDHYAFFRNGWSIADTASLSAAYEYIESIQAAGGTEVQKALSPCLDLFEKNNREQLLVFLTDGDVGNEASLLNLIENKIGRVRLFAFGIGDAPNETLITKMAAAGNGQARFIKNDNAVDKVLADFFTTLSTPVLSNLRISLLDARDQPIEARFFPEKVGDVFHGRPLQASFRITGQPAASVRIDGVEEDRPVTFKVQLQPTPLRGDGIEKHFGRLWYESLEQDWRRTPEAGEKEMLRKLMLDTALLFQLVTPLTSRVAVDQEISRNPTAPLNSQKVGQARPADQMRADGTLELSPFVVSEEEDQGYNTAGSFAGSRLRDNGWDEASIVSIVTDQFLEDFGRPRLEDATSFTMEPEQNPTIARSGADDALLSGLPIATVIDPATVNRIELKTSGLTLTDVDQRRAALVGKSSLIARVGDEGTFAGSLESSFRLGQDSNSRALAIVSWQKFDQSQWSAFFNARSDFGDDRLFTTVQARQLEGYGNMQMARVSFDHQFDNSLTLEGTLAWHELHRENARQFERSSPTAQYDNLGFLNLDLLTAETRNLKDAIAQIQLGGTTPIASAQNSWAIHGTWHRQTADWVSSEAAPERETASLSFSNNTSFPNQHISIRTDLGLTHFHTPGEMKSPRSASKAALGASWEFLGNLNAFANASTEEFLAWVPTGIVQYTERSSQAVSQPLEHRHSIQVGLNASVWNDRLSAKVALFNENITDHAYRDWAWERDHATTGPVTLADGSIRLPVSYARWNDLQREGWMGEINFMPSRAINCRATWFCDWKNEGPYRGGNRQASLVTTYTFQNGELKGLTAGFGTSARNTMEFNDGYKLEGGVRCDLLLGYRYHLSEAKWMKVQLNLMNLSGSPWQPTRFAKDHGQQLLLTVSREF